MKNILVTGAGGPAGVNFIMSLKIAPEKMFLAGTEADRHLLHLAPTDRKYLIPEAKSAEYINALNEIIRKENIQFVHAQPDIEVSVLSENRDSLRAKVFLPSNETILACQDKHESAKLWRRNGIPAADFLLIKEEKDIQRAFDSFGAPLWIRATKGAGGQGSTPVPTRESAAAWVKYWKSRNVDWEFIAQEHLPGRNLAFHSLWKQGELIVSMARERLTYVYPRLAPSGITGTPSVQRTIHDKRINEIGRKAVLSIDRRFNGIACVDLKEDREGKPRVTEINAGRMFTTSFFFSYASKELRKDYYANIPYLYLRLAFGEKIPTVPKYDILPKDIYWIRHIDAPARLVKNGRIIGEMYG